MHARIMFPQWYQQHITAALAIGCCTFAASHAVIFLVLKAMHPFYFIITQLHLHLKELLPRFPGRVGVCYNLVRVTFSQTGFTGPFVVHLLDTRVGGLYIAS